jgi:hypothetical protein
MRRLSVVIGLLALTIVPLSLPAPASASYSLTAQGVWTSNDGLLNGTWEAHFDVAGYDLSGTLNILGLAEVGEGNIQGSWDAEDIGFGVMFLGQELATFDGGFDGSGFSGTFDTGTTSGYWNGLLESIQLTTAPVTPILDGANPTLVLSRVAGQIGQIVDLTATLHTFGSQISNLENIITFDSLTTPIATNVFGRPDCTVNADINKFDTFFEFLPNGCSGNGCNQVRAVVRSLSNLAAIADGANLYTCKVQIASQTTAGIYQILSNVVTALNSVLDQLPVDSLPGEIGVKAKKLLGDCSCHIPGESNPVPLASILLPLAFVAARRFSTRSVRARN